MFSTGWTWMFKKNYPHSRASLRNDVKGFKEPKHNLLFLLGIMYTVYIGSKVVEPVGWSNLYQVVDPVQEKPNFLAIWYRGQQTNG